MAENEEAFDYATAFSRNLGFLNAVEQDRLRHSRVAVAGLGGAGGVQAHVLARMGIGQFTLADPDTFELANFNRQIGATMNTVGRRKTEVAVEQVKAINPEADVRLFDEGVTAKTIDAFLLDVDVVDSLDFYCFAERRLLYAAARERGLWGPHGSALGLRLHALDLQSQGHALRRLLRFPAEHERARTGNIIDRGNCPQPIHDALCRSCGYQYGRSASTLRGRCALSDRRYHRDGGCGSARG